jgi:hypothetical protein
MTGRARSNWQPPTCPSGKVSYRTQGRALYALRKIRETEAQAAAKLDQTAPRSAYRCGRCGAWHLTRQTGGVSL